MCINMYSFLASMGSHSSEGGGLLSDGCLPPPFQNQTPWPALAAWAVAPRETPCCSHGKHTGRSYPYEVQAGQATRKEATEPLTWEHSEDHERNLGSVSRPLDTSKCANVNIGSCTWESNYVGHDFARANHATRVKESNTCHSCLAKQAKERST